MAKQKQNNSNDAVVSNDSTEAKKFVDPFAKGVTYSDVIEALGNKTIAEYYDGLLEPDQMTWLETEIEHFKNKK